MSSSEKSGCVDEMRRQQRTSELSRVKKRKMKRPERDAEQSSLRMRKGD